MILNSLRSFFYVKIKKAFSTLCNLLFIFIIFPIYQSLYFFVILIFIANWLVFSVVSLLSCNKSRVIFYKKPNVVETENLFEKVKYYFNLKNFLGLYTILQIYKFIKINRVLSFFVLIAFLVLKSLLTVSLLLLFLCFRITIYGESLLEVFDYLIKSMEKGISDKLIWVESGRFFINGQTNFLKGIFNKKGKAGLIELKNISQKQLIKAHKEPSQENQFNDYYRCMLTRKAVDGISLIIRGDKTLNEEELFNEFGRNETIRAANILVYGYERKLVNEVLLKSGFHYGPETRFTIAKHFISPYSEHYFSNLGDHLIMTLGSNLTKQRFSDDFIEILASPFKRTKHSNSPFIEILKLPDQDAWLQQLEQAQKSNTLCDLTKAEVAFFFRKTVTNLDDRIGLELTTLELNTLGIANELHEVEWRKDYSEYAVKLKGGLKQYESCVKDLSPITNEIWYPFPDELPYRYLTEIDEYSWYSSSLGVKQFKETTNV